MDCFGGFSKEAFPERAFWSRLKVWSMVDHDYYFVMKSLQRSKGSGRFRRMISLNNLSKQRWLSPLRADVTPASSLGQTFVWASGDPTNPSQLLCKVSFWENSEPWVITSRSSLLSWGSLSYLPGSSLSMKNPTRGWVSPLCGGLSWGYLASGKAQGCVTWAWE